MPEDVVHHFALVHLGDDPHGMLTPRADERVGVPDLQEEGAPFLEGSFAGGGGAVGRNASPLGRAEVRRELRHDVTG